METVNVLVAYASLPGNVDALAPAVAEGCSETGASVDVRRTDEVDPETIQGYDAFAFGSPTHCGTMSVKMNELFNRTLHPKHWGKLGYKVAVAFTSSGGLGGGNEMTLLSMISAILNFGMITFGVPDYVSRGVTLHYGAVSIKEPDEDSLNACRLLGRRLVEHAAVIKAGLARA